MPYTSYTYIRVFLSLSSFPSSSFHSCHVQATSRLLLWSTYSSSNVYCCLCVELPGAQFVGWLAYLLERYCSDVFRRFGSAHISKSRINRFLYTKRWLYSKYHENLPTVVQWVSPGVGHTKVVGNGAIRWIIHHFLLVVRSYNVSTMPHFRAINTLQRVFL